MGRAVWASAQHYALALCSSRLRPQLDGYLKHASPQQCAAVARAATPPPTPPPAPPVPTPPLPSPHEHPPRRLAATHAVAALTPLPTALQLASKDAAYSLDSPANVSRLRLTLAHGMVRWYLTTRDYEAAACGVSHPFCAVSHCGSAQSQKQVRRVAWRSNYAVVRPSETRNAACSP